MGRRAKEPLSSHLREKCFKQDESQAICANPWAALAWKSLDPGVRFRGQTGDVANCCTPRAAPNGAVLVCPVSGTQGKPLEFQTVKALLTEAALRRIVTSSYRFCPEPACDVVYFDETGHTYVKTDVRVPVWQKEPFGERMICYCFGENETDIRREFETTGGSDAVERVRKHIEAGRCACEVRNPRGVCCLGDIGAAVARVRATAGAVE